MLMSTKKPNIESMPSVESIGAESNYNAAIDQNDLEELRTLYAASKNIINKIEIKYGHLLNINQTESKRKLKKRKLSTSNEEHSDKFVVKKKILYDDDGNELVKEFKIDNRICLPHNMCNVRASSDQIEVQFDENNLNYPDDTLPNDLSTLSDILLNSELDDVYRNKVLSKFMSMKRDNLNEIKFNKSNLVKETKIMPESIFEFKGSNLSSISGYL